MDKIQEEIIKSVEIIVAERIKSLKLDYTVTGNIKSIMSDTYIVTIDGFDSSPMKAREGLNLQVGDIVHVRVIQGNYSNKFIDCKKP